VKTEPTNFQEVAVGTLPRHVSRARQEARAGDALAAVIRLDCNNKSIQYRAMTGGTLLRFRGDDETAKTSKTLPAPPVVPEYLKK